MSTDRASISPSTTRVIDQSIPICTAILALITVALVHKEGQESIVGRALVAWMLWSVFGMFLSARGIQEKVVRKRGNPFVRAGSSFTRTVGLLGAAVASALIVLQLVAIPPGWQGGPTRWVCGAVALMLILVPGRPRRAGVGLLIAALAPVWTLALVLFLVYFAVPTFLTLATSAIITFREMRRRHAKEGRLGQHGPVTE